MLERSFGRYISNASEQAVNVSTCFYDLIYQVSFRGAVGVTELSLTDYALLPHLNLVSEDW